MTDIPETTFAFISYAHPDAKIAEEIERQLFVLAGKGKGKFLLKCFLDSKSIPMGQRFQPIIRAALEQADWLIAVFTDHQSVYCGYEIGIYSVVKPHDGMSLNEKPVVCIHDIDQSRLPSVVDGYKSALVGQVAPYDSDDPIPSGEEVNLWFESPVGKCLREFLSAKNLYTPIDSPSEFTVDIAKAAKKICCSFAEARQDDEVSETPIQAGMEVTIYPTDGELLRIPESSILVGSSRAFDILGLVLPMSLSGNMAPQMTWGELRAALSRPERANIPGWTKWKSTSLGPRRGRRPSQTMLRSKVIGTAASIAQFSRGTNYTRTASGDFTSCSWRHSIADSSATRRVLYC